MATNKQDSNLTGLRYARESSLRVLPGSGGVDAVWHPLEPNSYNDFGANYAKTARNPINAARQRKKGATTDMDASGGFNQDLTIDNSHDLLQGFFFAAMRQKATTASLNGAAVVISAVDGTNDQFEAASGLGSFKLGALVKASGFTNAINNGIHYIDGVAAGALDTTTNLVTETPPAGAKVETVGFQLVADEAAIALNGSLVRLTASTTDLTTLGLIAGEWIFVGGDASINHFDDNIGFARIKTIAAGYLEFDKVTWASPANEAGTGLTIRLFFGNVLRNEFDPTLITKRTYNLERTLGVSDLGALTQAEYLEGAVANELTLNVPEADKINMDLSFVAIAHTTRGSDVGPKPGTRLTLPANAEAFNTTENLPRIRLSLVDPADATVTPLFAFATDLTLTVNNNVTVNKALGVLGGFDTSIGTFEVGGSLNVYFSDVAAIAAIRDNSDVTLDFAMVQENTGFLFDVPLLSLGDGRLDVQQDQAIMLPLENSAAESDYGYTLLMMHFPYLPDLAG